MNSSNKSTIFPDKHKSDTEETSLKHPNQYAFTSKQETSEIIKRLHIKCGFLDTEHLFMLPKTWLEYLQYEEVDVDITENLYNANCTPVFFAEKYFEIWDPKIHGPRNYLQSFYVAALIEERGTEKHYPLAMFQNGISKIPDHLIKE